MRHQIFIAVALLNILCWGNLFAQEITFSKEKFSNKGTTLLYRKADISGLENKAMLVIYLHGGSSKGNDNELQMQEPGVNAVATWLYQNNHKAIMLVPQCPQDKSWLGTMQDLIVILLQSYIDRDVVDATKVFILGGSMGGTGTWNMLSNHPELFGAAMPVAGNPTGLDAEAVSQTPIYTVMGTADRIMKISNVEAFLGQMDNYNAEYEFDIEDGWTHEDVCKQSYTDIRLDWLFQHTKESATAINGVVSDDCNIDKVVWFTTSGQRLASEPMQGGLYIKKSFYSDGSTSSEKLYIK